MLRIRRFAPLVATLVFSLSAFAQDGQVLTYQTWKEQQVLEAQNQVLRNSARINQIKMEKRGSTETKDQRSTALPSARIKKAGEITLQEGERDLKRAQESLETANSLQLEDYIAIYLPTLQDRPEALNKLAEKLSKDDLAQIFKSLVQRNSKANDSSRNQEPVLEGLTAASHAKGL